VEVHPTEHSEGVAVWAGPKMGVRPTGTRPGHNIYPDERSDDGADDVYPTERNEGVAVAGRGGRMLFMHLRPSPRPDSPPKKHPPGSKP